MLLHPSAASLTHGPAPIHHLQGSAPPHQGLRDTVQEVFGTSRVATTCVCVALITALGIQLTNLGTVAAVSGALVSTSLVYVLPGIMFYKMLSAKVRTRPFHPSAAQLAMIP